MDKIRGDGQLYIGSRNRRCEGVASGAQIANPVFWHLQFSLMMVCLGETWRWSRWLHHNLATLHAV